MTLSARAIALQGFGFGALLVAAQGFATVDALVPITPIGPNAGGNSHGKDTGRRVRERQHIAPTVHKTAQQRRNEQILTLLIL